jgi:hypothetical protein
VFLLSKISTVIGCSCTLEEDVVALKSSMPVSSSVDKDMDAFTTFRGSGNYSVWPCIGP